MDEKLKYDFDLTEKVSNILSYDFWVLKKFGAAMLPPLFNPLKFTSNVSIYIRTGNGQFDIDLLSYKILAPCVVNIRAGQILQVKDISEDFDSSFIVMSKRFCDNIFLLLQDSSAYSVATRTPVFNLRESVVTKFERFYENVYDIFIDKENPNSYQSMTLALGSFFFEIAYQCFPPVVNPMSKWNNRIIDRFISLVQQNFKKERFLEFYAEQLEITPKHLSRTMKTQTGFTAVEWIERYVILEAKVMLKSTNLSIQQISDELNFPSQSFFGKYFKKNVGMSPKEFRNS